MDELLTSLHAIKPGQKIVYHIGLLYRDADPAYGGEEYKRVAALRALAKMLADRGRVHLVQRIVRTYAFYMAPMNGGDKKLMQVHDYAYVAVGAL